MSTPRFLDLGSLSSLLGTPRQTSGAFGGNLRRGTQRLKRATGPGSLNEANEMQALVDAGKAAEAAAYYERCHQINYRAGKPKMRWGDVWYAYYKAGDARARGVESQS
jgi:hypothetical protein